MPIYSPLRFITPRHVQRAAQILVVPIMIGIMLVHAQGAADMIRAATGSYLLSIALLLAFPNVRSGDLAVAAVLFLTGVEFGSAVQGTPVDFARWLVTMGALGMVIVPLKTQRIRALTLYAGWRPFAGGDRRRRSRTPPVATPLFTEAVPSPVRGETLLLPHATLARSDGGPPPAGHRR